MALEFPHLLPFKHNHVTFGFPPYAEEPQAFCIKPLSSIELLWVNNISSTFVPPLPLVPDQEVLWLDRMYPDVYVPHNVIKPLLEEAYLCEHHPYENTVATCWISGNALICFPTGKLMDTFSALVIDSSLPPKLSTAIEEKSSLPGNSVCVGAPIRHIKFNATQSKANAEDLLVAVATDMNVLVYRIIPRNDESVQIRLVTKLPFKDQICSLAFTDEYLVTVTADGSIYSWDPLHTSQLRVLKRGTKSSNSRLVCTPGSPYHTVFVSNGDSLYAYDFRQKITYQKPLLHSREGDIMDSQLHPSNSFHLAVHTKNLCLYDIRYTESPFISWSSSSSRSCHSIHVLPMQNRTNFIVSAFTNGEVQLYQYKDGIPPPALTKRKWDPYQPLSSLASQFPAFNHTSPFLQTTIPYPIQVPYSFSTVHSIESTSLEVVPRFAGAAVLANWVMTNADSDFQLFQINHYGDIYVQSFSLSDPDSNAPAQQELEMSALGEVALRAYQTRAREMETRDEIPTIILPAAKVDTNEEAPAPERVLNYLEGIASSATLDEVSDHSDTSANVAYDTLSDYEITDAETDYEHDTDDANILKRTALDPRVACVPSEDVPSINEAPENSTVTDEIKPYLHVYMVNSKLLDRIIPISASTLSSTTADRSKLENAFKERMERFKEEHPAQVPASQTYAPSSQSSQPSFSITRQPSQIPELIPSSIDSSSQSTITVPKTPLFMRRVYTPSTPAPETSSQPTPVAHRTPFVPRVVPYTPGAIPSAPVFETSSQPESTIPRTPSFVSRVPYTPGAVPSTPVLETSSQPTPNTSRTPFVPRVVPYTPGVVPYTTTKTPSLLPRIGTYTPGTVPAPHPMSLSQPTPTINRTSSDGPILVPSTPSSQPTSTPSTSTPAKRRRKSTMGF